jgi:guanylate kinase
MGKLLIFAAPSGAGKTTIVRHLLRRFDNLAFSISATTRPKRSYEVAGADYYFLSSEEFDRLVKENAFVEWEEVYEGLYYGTLRSEIQRLWADGKHIIFDIDVKGAMNIKKAFPDESLAVFVKPPSLEDLIERLRRRQTESEESFKKRVARMTEEMTYQNKFDVVLVNDVLEVALEEAERITRDFLGD